MQDLSLAGRSAAAGVRLLSSLVAFATITGPSPAVVQAQEAGPSPQPGIVETSTGVDPSGRPVVRPTRTDTPPRIDGRLDDPIWQTAAKITRFVQQSPLDGAPATEDTEVYIAYDSDHIYFGFHVHYEDPSIMRANRVDRDRAAPDDLMTVYFDTFMDQQRGYDFDVNGYGVQGDGIISAGGGGGAIPRADRSWDTLFETAGQIVEDGYVAEMAIPFKSLRYPTRARDEPHRWGFQIVREIKGKDQENDVWAPMSRDESSFFAQMGVIEGMTNLSRSRNLEILPTFTAIQYGEIDPSQGRYVDQGTDPDAGVNLKYGVTSNLTADFTINPDFSQIESDRGQIEVNQRFPIFFPELRPFFVEGAEIFNVPAPVTLVHTRTIVDPDWGAKLTGKVGAASIGFVATNDRAPARLHGTSAGFGDGAHTIIGRARYDLYAESNVGATLTNREFLDSHSRLLGLDGNFRLSPTISYDFRAFAARHRDLENVETAGHMVATRLNQSGRNLSASLAAYQVSPDFQTDVGFVRRTDQRWIQGNGSYNFWPESWIISWGPQINYGRNWDFDSTLQDEELGVGLNFNFARNISLSGDLRRDMERFGGTEFEKTRFSVRANVNTSRSFSFGGNYVRGDEIRYIASPFLGTGSNWGVNASVRPMPRLESRLNVSSSRLTDPRNDGADVFDVKIFRAFTTYQFTDRINLRNIAEYNTFDEAIALNVLLNYRINAGTVFFVGYDDHYQQGNLIELVDTGEGEHQLYLTDELRRTNRAIFVKLQYLLRY
ncbi:MAG: DUF5916 domain-containing protein [Gemmatimonadota bacterium]